MHRWRVLAAGSIAGFLLAACSNGGSTTPPDSAETHTPSAQDMFDVGGYRLSMRCEGTGSPTVVFEAGAGGDSNWFGFVAPDIVEETTVCAYDRAGIGASDDRPKGTALPTAGTIADELQVLLDTAGAPAPYILVGHSFGGMVVQLFADRHPDDVVGLVLVDSAMGGQVSNDEETWEDGAGNLIDIEATKTELEATGPYGATPLVVLTQSFADTDDVPERFQRRWLELQTEFAARSTDVIHVIATRSGHMIQEQEPDLVIAAIREVLAAAREGGTLAPCDDRFREVGGACAA